jgi:phosphoribosylamine--glycine ligase
VLPVNINFEHKKLYPGDIGPSTGEMGTTMFWSEPTRIFNATLKKMEPRLREEGYVGYIDVNCMVNSNGIYPLEFTSRFGYPTISIQQEGMLTPIGELFYRLAEGSITQFKARSGFQVGVRIMVPPFPYTDPETFAKTSKDAVIIFKKPSRDGVHIEGREAGQQRMGRHRHLRRRADRRRHRDDDESRAETGLQPRRKHHDPQHVLSQRHRGPMV